MPKPRTGYSRDGLILAAHQAESEYYSKDTLNEFAVMCHLDNEQWWRDLRTGEPLDRNKGELLALIHSEISECLEGVRKGQPDSHLPHRSAEEVELADALIRIFDYAGAFGLDLDGAFWEKRAYNKQRADHKREARLAPGGKKI